MTENAIALGTLEEGTSRLTVKTRGYQTNCEDRDREKDLNSPIIQQQWQI
jgi:hypothetical protein